MKKVGRNAEVLGDVWRIDEKKNPKSTNEKRAKALPKVPEPVEDEWKRIKPKKEEDVKALALKIFSELDKNKHWDDATTEVKVKSLP